MAFDTDGKTRAQTEDPGSRPGLFSALKGISGTLLATGRTRLELLANEVEEEKQRILRLLLLAQAMVFCVALGVILAVGLLALLFWDNRIVLVGSFAGLFLLLAAVFFRAFSRAARRPEKVFAASIAELEEDLRQLRAAADRETPAP